MCVSLLVWCLSSAAFFRPKATSNIHLALPFCHVTLRAPKPKPPNYPRNPNTLGAHIRKRSPELGLLQREVAKQIGADATTIYRWENNETSPPVRHIPQIIQFLGYNPLPPGSALLERLKICRKILGLSQKALARPLGVDPTTLGMWERGKRYPSKKLLGSLKPSLGLA